MISKKKNLFVYIKQIHIWQISPQLVAMTLVNYEHAIQTMFDDYKKTGENNESMTLVL